MDGGGVLVDPTRTIRPSSAVCTWGSQWGPANWKKNRQGSISSLGLHPQHPSSIRPPSNASNLWSTDRLTDQLTNGPGLEEALDEALDEDGLEEDQKMTGRTDFYKLPSACRPQLAAIRGRSGRS